MDERAGANYESTRAPISSSVLVMLPSRSDSQNIVK